MPENTYETLNFLNFVDEPVFYLSSDFIVLESNAGALNTFNRKKDAIIGESFSTFCPDFNSKASELIDSNLITHLGEKTLTWHFLMVNKPDSDVNYIVTGEVNNKKNKSSLHNIIKKKGNETTLDDIANQFLAEQLKDQNKNISEYDKGIYHFMENIIAQIPVSVYWMNKECVYLGCSNSMANLLNLKSRHDIVGKTYDDLYDEKATAHYKKADKTVMNKGIPLMLEEPLYFPDGTHRIYLSNKIPLHDLEGKIIGMLGVSVDITDRKKMEAALETSIEKTEAANYIMTEFIANMGHDLATPISDVISMAHLLNCYIDEYPEFKEDFEVLMTRSEDCEKVRKRIINATSISNLEIKAEKFPISLELLAIETELRSAIGSKNLKLIIHPMKPKKEDHIETDRIKFHDILFDLISNAINFTEEGQVVVTVLKESDSFHIRVSDTGIGIPSDKFEYIFQQYTKIARSNQHGANFKGVGAGLYLARIRASILNATISVESEINKGSTFTLTIPVSGVKNNNAMP